MRDLETNVASFQLMTNWTERRIPNIEDFNFYVPMWWLEGMNLSDFTSQLVEVKNLTKLPFGYSQLVSSKRIV